MIESIAKDLTRMRDMMEYNELTAKWKQKTDDSIPSDLVKSLKFVLLEGMKDTVAKKFFQEVIHHIRGLLFKPDDPKQFYAYILGNNDSNKSLGKDIHIKYASSFVLCFFFFWPPPPAAAAARRRRRGYVSGYPLCFSKRGLVSVSQGHPS